MWERLLASCLHLRRSIAPLLRPVSTLLWCAIDVNFPNGLRRPFQMQGGLLSKRVGRGQKFKVNGRVRNRGFSKAGASILLLILSHTEEDELCVVWNTSAFLFQAAFLNPSSRHPCRFAKIFFKNPMASRTQWWCWWPMQVNVQRRQRLWGWGAFFYLIGREKRKKNIHQHFTKNIYTNKGKQKDHNAHGHLFFILSLDLSFHSLFFSPFNDHYYVITSSCKGGVTAIHTDHLEWLIMGVCVCMYMCGCYIALVL